jgi:hypothetical protein
MATTEPRGQNKKLNNLNTMEEQLKNAKAYAAELERIINAVTIDPNQRILVNALVGSAKEKYNMYN